MGVLEHEVSVSEVFSSCHPFLLSFSPKVNTSEFIAGYIIILYYRTIFHIAVVISDLNLLELIATSLAVVRVRLYPGLYDEE